MRCITWEYFEVNYTYLATLHPLIMLQVTTSKDIQKGVITSHNLLFITDQTAIRLRTVKCLAERFMGIGKHCANISSHAQHTL